MEVLQKKNSELDVEAAMSCDHASPSSSLCIEIGELLSKLRARNDDMSRIAEPRNQHTATRHREILREYEAEYAKVKANLELMVERAQLFGGSSPNSTGISSASQLLLRERNAIGAAHAAADACLGSAMASRESMQEQNSLMNAISSKLLKATQQFPAINQVVGAVQKRKARDQLIIAGVVSLCIFFTLRYLFF